jgi:uncharacterized protein
MTEEMTAVPVGIHALAKPRGPLCNLKCDYCFYLEKENLFPNQDDFRMSEHVLRRYIQSYILSQETPEVEFVWHGGEPALAGIDFYRKAVEYQRAYGHLKVVKNSFQTNGTLLTDEWCEFFKINNFFIGLSLDGPEQIHGRYRRKRDGQPSFKEVLKGLRLLQKHGVEYNILACVTRETACLPLEIYRFFKDQAVEFIQFTPVIERMPDPKAREYGLGLAMPPVPDGEKTHTQVTPWSVESERYGDFLIAIYEEWVRHDVGKVFVMNFEWTLNAWIGNPSPVCIFSRQCGRAVAVEHNGDVYACDHYVYPEYRLGNLRDRQLGDMVQSSVASGFGPHKETSLPKGCRECEVLKACWGGCPKHRFMKTGAGEPGLHYLCPGYKKFFKHIRKYLRAMAQLLENGLPVSLVMQAVEGPLMIDLGKAKHKRASTFK